MLAQSPILWQNSTATVTLIDIPQSIASAQGTAKHPFPYHLLSSAPLSCPFPDIEPKSAKARSRLGDGDSELGLQFEELHDQYHAILQRALEEIKSEYRDSWCLPRPFVEDASRSTKRRRLSDDNGGGTPPSRLNNEAAVPSSLPSDMLSSLARDDQDMPWTMHPVVSDQLRGTDQATIKNVRFIHNFNPHPQHSASLKLTSPISLHSSTYSFHLPPDSSFSLSDCTDSFSFRKHLRKHTQEKNTPMPFDFIILDPPWPNRSVLRTHGTPGSTYSVASTASDIREMLFDMRIDMLMSEDCLVGIWITNKASIRELVLGESGLFDCCDIELVEEWLWLKTTVSGEPILPCNGLYRKPYEVLLLGRKRRLAKDIVTAQDECLPKRRVIFAVPDLHSRKPCLKKLIEPLLQRKKDYRALEIFARYLVAGWCSWGDECIKFDWDGYWQKIAAS